MNIPNRTLKDEVRDAYGQRLNAFAQTLQEWTSAGSPETAEQAARLRDFLAGAKALAKEADEDRKVRKKVYDDGAKEVQDAFKVVADALEKIERGAKELLVPFLEAEAQRLAREAEERERTTREALERATAGIEIARASGDVFAQQDAEEAEKAAAKALRTAGRVEKVKVGSASGGARALAPRKVRVATVVDLTRAFMAVRNDPAVREAIEAAGNRIVRAASYDGEPLAGFEITERSTV